MDEQTFFEKLGTPVTAEQKEIIKADDAPTAVLASAGSGKTTTLINRMLYQIYVKNVQPTSILAVTFSRNAKSDMAKRFKKQSANFISKGELPGFYTFHGLFLRLLNESNIGGGYRQLTHPNAFYTALASILKFKKVSDNFKTLDDIFDASSSFINNFLTPDGIVDYDGQPLDLKYLLRYDNISIEDYTQVVKRYQKLKIDNHKIDFDDMQVQLYQFLKHGKAELVGNLIKSFNHSFKYFYFDEFQDVSDLQYNIINTIFNLSDNKDWKRSVVIGDPNQAIYSFRGSNEDLLKNFASKHNGNELNLSVNFRCPQNILSPVLSVVDNKKQPTAFNKGGEVVFVEGLNKLFEMINKYHSEDDNDAIIVRQNANASLIVDELVRKDIPVKVSSEKQLLDNNKFFKDILSVISLCKTHGKEHLKRLAYRLFNFDKGYYSDYAIKTKQIKEFNDDEECWQTLVVKNSRISKQQKELLKEIEKANDMETLLNDTKKLLMPYYDELINQHYISNFEVQNAFDYLTNEYQKMTFQEFMNERLVIKDKIQKWNRKRKILHVCTVHAVKGLEFDNVFFINLTQGIIPNNGNLIKKIENDDENNFNRELSEERHIFYVAWTRAKKRLIVEYQADDAPLFLKELNTDVPKVEHHSRYSNAEYYSELSKNIKNGNKHFSTPHQIDDNDIFSKLYG